MKDEEAFLNNLVDWGYHYTGLKRDRKTALMKLTRRDRHGACWSSPDELL
jgi:hypothetical protein